MPYDYQRRIANEKLEDHPNIRPWFKPWVEREYGRITSIDSKYMRLVYNGVLRHLPKFTVETERGTASLILDPAGKGVVQKDFYELPDDDDEDPRDRDRGRAPSREQSLERRVKDFMDGVHAKDWKWELSSHHLYGKVLSITYGRSGEAVKEMSVYVEYLAPLLEGRPASGLVIVNFKAKMPKYIKVEIKDAASLRKVLDDSEKLFAEAERDFGDEREKAEAVKKKLEEQEKKREEAKERRKQQKPARESQKDARDRILAELAKHGWDVRPKLKVPWAKKPREYDQHTLYFKGVSAIYLDEHSMHIDISGMPIVKFLQHVDHEIKKRDRDPQLWGHYRR